MYYTTFLDYQHAMLNVKHIPSHAQYPHAVGSYGTGQVVTTAKIIINRSHDIMLCNTACIPSIWQHVGLMQSVFYADNWRMAMYRMSARGK
jgi:hypothetical protein